MYGFGFDEKGLRNRTYPQMAYIAVLNLTDYVKDGNEFGIIPFTSTSKWMRLKKYCEEREL